MQPQGEGDFTTLNVGKQPPGHSTASAPQPWILFLALSLRQKLRCPPPLKTPHILHFYREAGGVAAGGDLETMVITQRLSVLQYNVRLSKPSENQA